MAAARRRGSDPSRPPCVGTGARSRSGTGSRSPQLRGDQCVGGRGAGALAQPAQPARKPCRTEPDCCRKTAPNARCHGPEFPSMRSAKRTGSWPDRRKPSACDPSLPHHSAGATGIARASPPHDGRYGADHTVITGALARTQSATSLQLLLRGPLGFVWKYALGWRAPEDLQQPLTITPEDFGKLVHELLRRTVDALEPSPGFGGATREEIEVGHGRGGTECPGKLAA